MSDPAQGPSAPARPLPFDPHRGQHIGRYEVLSQLSVGGMAELFLGYTSGPGGFRKYTAIKRILPDARSDEQFERMFLDEARITAALNHPNIGQVFELGQDKGGLFLAMEFIAGQNLEQVIQVGRQHGGVLPLGFSLSVIRDVCLALHYAHTFTTPGGRPHPVVHRDVAHKNVMVTYDGVVKLLDFGIAKAKGARAQTQVGMVKGTTGYMSPEQVRGDPLDGRSDLFSVGVMLHELLTGERLFAANSEIQEMQMILGAPIPEPQPKGGGIKKEICAVALKALARDRTQRYATGREMARALEAAAGPLLFDAEQSAALMARHFARQRESTRQLLQTVDETLDGQTAQRPALGAEVLSAPTEVRLGDDDVSDLKTEVKPSRVIEETRRRMSEKRPAARSAAPRRPASSENGPSEKVATDRAVTDKVQVDKLGGEKLATTGRVVSRPPSGVHAPVAPAEPPRVTKSSLGLWVGMLVLGGLLGLAAMEARSLLHAEQASASPPTGADPFPVTPLPQPPAKDTPKEGPKDGPKDTATVAGKTPAPEAPADAPAETRPSRQGWLTLVILPEAEVFLNGRSLGMTPLFKRPVAVGQHRLRIQGKDGKRRELSVPIEQGKTVQLKLSLADIPER